jgi:hypothetical protein
MQETIKQTGKTETKTTLVAYGREWEVTIVDANSPYSKPRYNWKKGGYIQPLTRVFVSTSEEFDDFATAAHPHPMPDMFPLLALESVYTSRGDYPEVDKAWDQFNRAFVKGQSLALSAIAHLTGVDEFRFDKRAGCTCPCSPGFIAKSGKRSRGTYIFVNIKEVSA